jgi:hypothetical protein
VLRSTKSEEPQVSSIVRSAERNVKEAERIVRESEPEFEIALKKYSMFDTMLQKVESLLD